MDRIILGLIIILLIISFVNAVNNPNNIENKKKAETSLIDELAEEPNILDEVVVINETGIMGDISVIIRQLWDFVFMTVAYSTSIYVILKVVIVGRKILKTIDNGRY